MNKFLALFSVRRLVECRSISVRLTADGKEVPKRKVFENRITLIGTDNSVSITDLKNAQNLSERRELKLVKLQDVDSKTRRPVYKLMTNTEYHLEELEHRHVKQTARQNDSKKGEKLLTLSSKIEEHDLMTGIRKMVKLLDKQYEVRVIVTADGDSSCDKSEHIYSVIERNIKMMGKVVQKRVKGNTLRFQLIPMRNSKSQSDQTNTDSDNTENNSHKNSGPI